jgi:predicted  nucleic acid-binding Zn-ribbon protein
MTSEASRIAELEDELVHLMEEVERYRSAAEDALQQLDWCIGYLAGANKGQVAKVLSANRAHIRRTYLRRAEQHTPSSQAALEE